MADGTEDPGQPSLKDFVQDHLALVATVIPVVLVLAKVVAFSEFDTTTGRALLETLSPIEALTGTLIAFSATIFLIAGVMMFVYGWRNRQGALGVPIMTAGSSVLVTVVLVAPLFVILTLVGLTVLLVMFDRLFVVRRGGTSRINALVAVSVLLVNTANFIISPQTFWLPAERVSIEGREPIVGYVLSSGARWTTVLIKEDKEVRRIETSRVERRRLCDAAGPAGRSLVEFVRGEEGSPYPSC